MKQIFFLTAIIAILDSLFLFLTQSYTGTLYSAILPEKSTIRITYIFACWFCIGISMYFLIVSRPDFRLLTILKTAPVLGFIIYGIYSLGNHIANQEKWPLSFVGIDILRGIIIITTSMIIYGFFRKSFK